MVVRECHVWEEWIGINAYDQSIFFIATSAAARKARKTQAWIGIRAVISAIDGALLHQLSYQVHWALVSCGSIICPYMIDIDINNIMMVKAECHVQYKNV